MDQCRAVKGNGERCHYTAKAGLGGFCGHHFPKMDSKPLPAESKLSKVQKYVAIGSGLASVIKFVWDAIEQVAPTGRDRVYELSYASRINTLHSKAVELSSKAAQPNVDSEELQAEGALLDEGFNSWFSILPDAVKTALYKYLDKEKVEVADVEELHRALFYAVMHDYDKRMLR